jgi:formyltetrahydrofolate deformylase
MRVHVAVEVPTDPLPAMKGQFAELAARFDMDWELVDAASRARLLIMVSRHGHCLNDLLFRVASGNLAADVVAIVSNHRDFESLATSYRIPFHFLPTTETNRAEAESALLDLIAAERIDLVVLARYMQVLSRSTAEALTGRAINIHHGLLPSFRGPRPYHQAHSHGVKLIGATAHYVTADLDEGPIIEQEVTRVDHAFDPDALAAAGRDLECVALARAVQWHLARRVLLNGRRTVVFR